MAAIRWPEFVDNSLTRDLAHTYRATLTVLSSQNPMVDPKRPSRPMRWKLFLPISMPIVVTWSVAWRAMVHAHSGYCTQNLRVRLGARSVHPISGHRARRGTLSQRDKVTGRAFDRQIGSTKRRDRYADCQIRTGIAFDRHIFYATGDRKWSSGEFRLRTGPMAPTIRYGR